MVLLTKIVNNINLKTLFILAKRLIWITWLSTRRVSADGYITVLKIQMKTCKNGKRSFNHLIINKDHLIKYFHLKFKLEADHWNNYPKYLSVGILKKFCLEKFIFSKIPCFQHIPLKTFRQMRLKHENCSLRRVLF